MKNLITILLLLFSIGIYSQALIGKNTNELIENGFVKFNDSTYISITDNVDINVWVMDDQVVLEQYTIYDQKEVENLYIMLEENFVITDVKEEDIYFTSIITGATCIATKNVFTLYFKQ